MRPPRRSLRSVAVEIVLETETPDGIRVLAVVEFGEVPAIIVTVFSASPEDR